MAHTKSNVWRFPNFKNPRSWSGKRVEAPRMTMENWDFGKITIPPCVNCSIHFSVGPSLSDTTVMPHILSCHHSVCETCLIKDLKRKNKIICNKCKQLSFCPPGTSEFHMKLIFPYNHYFIGLSVEKMFFIGQNVDFTFRPVGSNVKPPPLECNNCVKDAAVRCIPCKVLYCDQCFLKAHISTDHQKVPVNYKANALSLVHKDACRVHDQKFEFYCGQCHEPACSRCLLAKHHGHNDVVELREANSAKRESLLESYANLSNVKTSLDNSAQKLAEYLSNARLSNRIKKTESQIKYHFADIHSRLSNLEYKLLKELKEDKNVKDAKNLIDKINEKSEEIDELLSFASELLKGKESANFYFQICIDALNSKMNTPCHLHSYFDQTEIQPLFTYNTEIFSTLEKHCSVKFPNTSFSLLSNSELPVSFNKDVQKLVKEDVENMLKKEIPKKTEKPETIVPAVTEGFVDYCPADGLESSVTISVFMSHIVSPHEFYVHRFGVEKKLRSIHDTISKYVRDEGPIAKVVKGQLYSALYKNQFWYRARVVRFEDETHVRVQYIDYGPVEKVAITSLRKIPPQLNTKYMGHGIRCYLKNCTPVSNKWDHAVIASMIKILNNKTCLMYIHKNENHTLEVSLYCPAESGYHNNMSKALSFLGFAKISEEAEPELEPEFDHKKILYKDPQVIAPKDTFYGIIVHVVNPSDFYMVNDQPYERKRYDAMEKDLQYCYNNELPPSFNIYQPHFDMPVAAYVDNKWFRASIVDTSSGQNINVTLVDIGRNVHLSSKKTKILMKRFIELPKRAIRCSLDDVDPKESVWCERSTEKLRSFMEKPLRVFVSFQEEVLAVKLIHRTISAEICVNAELVKEDLAVSTGPSSKVIEYQTVPEKEQTSQNKNKALFKMANAEIDGNDIIPFEGKVKVRVIFQYVKDPSEFYVILAYTSHETDRLIAEMDVEYSQNNNERLIDWNVGDKCAIKFDNWMRGVITKVNPDNKVEVYLCEAGSTHTVEMSQLRRLLMKFHHQKEGAYRCHLGGVIPPNEVWPGIAVSLFKEFIDENSMSLYIMEMDPLDLETDSTPVELYCKQIEDQGPLERPKIHWKSYNHFLYMHGYAKPDGTCVWNTTGRVFSTNKKSGSESIFEPSGGTNVVVSSSQAVEGLPKELNPQPKKLEQNLNWKPPSKFEKLEFSGCASHVTQEGIFVHSYSENHPVIAKITQALDKKYKGSIQCPEDQITRVGAPCVAKFLNKEFHRASIDKVASLTYVKYVDYGNIIAVPPSDIRQPILLDVPLQTTLCKWHKIKPIGPKFSDNALNHISALVLDKASTIKLIELPDGSYGIDKYTLPNEVDLFELIVKKELAVYQHQFKPKISSEVVKDVKTENLTHKKPCAPMYFFGSISGTGKNFKTFEIPHILTTLFVKCSAVLDDNLVMLELCNGPREINRHNYHFSLFEQVLNDEAPSMHFLSQPYLGKACCVLCNGQWHRGLVYDELKNGLISVILVDSGKLETVHGPNIREMKPEWFDTALKCVPARLFGLSVNKESGESRQKLIQLLSESLCKENTDPFLCSIKKRYESGNSNEGYAVQIFDKRTRICVYQNLIDLGYFNFDKDGI